LSNDFEPKSQLFEEKFRIGAYTTSWGVWPQFYWRKKWIFYCDLDLKSKKFQIVQIFKLSFRSPKNQETVKIFLCDCSPNLPGESLAIVDITTYENLFPVPYT